VRAHLFAIAVLLGAFAAPVAHAAPAAGKAEAPAVVATRKIFAAQLLAITRFGKYDPTAFAPDAAIFADTESYHGGWKPDEMPELFDTSSGGAGPAEVQKARFVAAADGKSAWMFAQLRVMEYNPGDGPGFWVSYRVTELVAEKDGAWKLVACYWSVGDPDAAVAKRYAEAGAVDAKVLADEAADHGDAELAALVGGAMREQRLADLIAERDDVVVVGSAPRELVVGGKKWKRALAAWKDKLHVVGGVRAEVAPGGTTGWALVTFSIDKQKKGKAYGVPFRVFFVLEKDAAGWQVVQAHLAVASF
jgi:hypothetical protein